MSPRTKTKAPAKKRSARAVVLDPFFGDPQITPAIKRAYDIAVSRYLHRPSVTGIDIGIKMKDGEHVGTIAVRIHVREKVDSKHLDGATQFPKTIEGVPVDVIQAVYKAVGGGGPPAAALAPAPVLRPGLSVGLLNGPTGTMGAIAREPGTNAPCFLSAAHVIAAGSSTSPGDPVIQPGKDDGGAAPDVVGQLRRANFSMDAAYALLGAQRPFDPRPMGFGLPIASTRFPLIGEVLQKTARSGNSQARVDGLGGYGLQFSFRLVPLVPGSPPISYEGDSGGVWYDPNTGEGVGLHCKGSLAPVPSMNFAVAVSLKKIVDFWGLLL